MPHLSAIPPARALHTASPHAALVACFVLLLLVFCPGTTPSAWADPHPVTVLGVQGELSDGERRAVQRRILRALEESADVVAVDQTDTSLTDALAFLGCGTISPECLAQVADVLEAPYLLFGALRAGVSAPTVSLTFFERATRTIVFTVSLDAPTHTEDDTFTRAVVSLLSGMGVLRIDAPPDATLEVAGRRLPPGTTLATDLTPGEVLVQLETPDGTTSTHAVYVEPYRVSTLHAAAFVADTPTRRPLRIAGWTTLGVGGALALGAVVAGARVGALQEEYYATFAQRRATELANDGAIAARWTTALLISAGVTLATGSGLLLTDRLRQDRSRRTEWAVWPNARGVTVQMGWTF